jgi:hypothetical protein
MITWERIFFIAIARNSWVEEPQDNISMEGFFTLRTNLSKLMLLWTRKFI